MGEIWFYHLQKRRLEEMLPPLLEKTLERGWRACIETPEAERLTSLDSQLWTFQDESFLPHGKEGEPDAADQPILLTGAQTNTNGAQVRFLMDGAQVDDASVYERVIYLFDGRDPMAVETARNYWRELKDGPDMAVYWQETDRGGWEKKSE